jgi:hypothetical protein
MKKMILSLLVLSSVAQSSELDNLINASSAMVDQIDKGIKLVGAATEYSYQGSGLSDGTLSSTAHISSEQLQAYNDALSGMSTYQPFGDIKKVLENKAVTELGLMDEAIDTFTEVVVDMIAVQEVAEMAESASSPQEEADLQSFVAENQEVLTITQEEVDTYNTSMDDIETHANNASAYTAVANNEQAVEFLEQGIENANTTAEQTNIFYDANAQWVAMGYNTTRNLTAVYLNNQSFNLDLYMSEADVLLAGAESEYYLTGPTSKGYNCFMYEMECEL